EQQVQRLAPARAAHRGETLHLLLWDADGALAAALPPPGERETRHSAAEFMSWTGTLCVLAMLELLSRARAARPALDHLVGALSGRPEVRAPFTWQRPAEGVAPEPPPRAPRAFDQLALGSFNEKLVIESIREAGALSRVEIAERTGLTPQAVSRITRNLLTSAFLVEDTHRPAGKGKPRVPLRLRADAACAIGIHLDPEMITQVVVDLCGGVVDQRRLPLHDRHDPDWVIDHITRMVREGIAASRPASDALLGIGIAVPGPLDTEAGVILDPPLFDGWRDVPLRAELTARLGIPVTVEKDATAAAIGERWIGTGERAGDFVYLYLGAGAGCGAFLNGDVYRGRTGNAGEFGELCALTTNQLSPEGGPLMVPECATMSAVVAKAVAAGLALPAHAPEPTPAAPGDAPAPGECAPISAVVDKATASGVLPRPRRPDPAGTAGTADTGPVPSAFEEVVAAAAAGDARAVEAFRSTARVLATGAIGVTDLLDTALLIVGGPAVPAAVAPIYLEEISAAVNRYPVARRVRRVHVAHSLLNESAAAMGAASGVFHASFAPRLRTHARTVARAW
uniref:ROK family transcriptional regulator n=1 Tax=Streptomyces sp. SBT349 TaxID=1580539 RepID=UPI00069D871A